MGQTNSKRLAIKSSRVEACDVQESIMDDVQTAGFNDNACFAIRLALEEGLANAIRHGNQGDPDKKIEIEYTISEDRIVLTICDEGPGFIPDELPDPTADENLEKPCGRGVMLIKAYMTDVSYNKRGNCVTMVKERNCQLPL